MVQDHFWKNAFSTHFGPIFGPKTTHIIILEYIKAFWDFPWAKTRHHGLQMGQNHLFEHPKWSWITFGKKLFSPIFDPFLVPKRPVFKAFWDFPWPKMRHHKLKKA